MDQQLTNFEQESTKSPIWLPIFGVIVFFVVVLIGVICPGAPPDIPDGGEIREQAEYHPSSPVRPSNHPESNFCSSLPLRSPHGAALSLVYGNARLLPV